VGWKRTLHFGKDTVLGLDIGSSAVKMVVLGKSKAGYSVAGASIARIAVDDKSNGDRRKRSVEAIRQCFARMGVKTKCAVCGVSGQDVAVRDFEFAPMPDAEIAAAVSLEASQVCPFNVTDMAVDYQVIPDGDARTKGVLVAATNAVVTGKTQLARQAGLKCVLTDVDGLALLNCHDGLAEGNETSATNRSVAILNVGASHTTLAIMDHNGWPFIRDMNHGGDDVITQIAALNDTSIETVTGALFDGVAAVEWSLRDSLEKACRKLIADVAGTLRYYAAQAKSTDVDRLLVCGGFALAEGFVELLNRRLGTEVVLWNPFDSPRTKTGRRCEAICAEAGPALAVAAGLAMRSMT